MNCCSAKSRTGLSYSYGKWGLVAVAINIMNADKAPSAAKSQLHADGKNARVSTMNGIAATICRGPVAVPPPHETIDAPYAALNKISATKEVTVTTHSARNSRRLKK